jgi:two-component system sensor histidine kinase TtrS
MTKVFTILLCFLLGAADAWANTNEVKIGVLAKRGYTKSHERWSATAEYLSASIPDYHFKIIPMTFGDIQVIVKNRLVDFVIVNPGIYVDLAETYGIRRVLTLINQSMLDSHVSQFGSVIFTLKSNTEISSLKDLKNQRVAAVHSTSLGGWIMALRELKAEGLDKWDFASLLFLNTHDAVVNAVTHRKAEVGIVRTDTLERMAMEGLVDIGDYHVLSIEHYDQFPYMISTPLYPEWPFSILPHTSPDLAKQVVISLLKLPPEHPAAKDAHIYGWTIPENYQPVSDLLKLLEIAPYDKPNQDKLGQLLTRLWPLYLIFALILSFLLILIFRVVRLNRSLSEHKSTLESSREAQVATFEQAAVGLAHITPSGEFLRMNRKLCDILSLSQNEMKKINLKDLLHTDDLPLCISIFDQLHQRVYISTSIQLRMICADGHSKWIQLSLSIKPNKENLTDYYVAVIDDIDKYKILEEQNLQAQQQKELILNIAGEGIIGLDNCAKHVFVNPAAAEMLGYSIEEMLGKNSHKLWHHSYADGSVYPEDECSITDVLRHGNVHRGECETVWRKDGTPIEVEFISTPIKEGKKITGAVVVLHLLSIQQQSPEQPQPTS